MRVEGGDVRGEDEGEGGDVGEGEEVDTDVSWLGRGRGRGRTRAKGWIGTWKGKRAEEGEGLASE